MKNKVGVVMGEFKRGDLKSSSGKKVTNPKQAMAIALSEAGKSKKGSDMKKMAAGGRMTAKGEHSVQTKSKRGAEMVKMAMGGKVKKMRMGGESTMMRDDRAEAAGRRVAKDIEYDERMKKGGMTKKMASGGACSYKKGADGVAKKGLTKPKMMRKGGKTC
jgi:hypothetical protein